ncbi:MAG: PHP domain-containing protein [Ruminococcaceae bacterium]|nr:PHP domain-containing protein [Oscillospiraceae bacterium]
MKTYLLPKDGHFYKANLHCHTNFSDGKKTPAEVKEIYQRLGYSIVAYTDHDILIPHDELTDDDFLALHGFEIEMSDYSEGVTSETRRTCHICCIGLEPETVVQPCWHRTLYQKHYFYGNAKDHAKEVKFDESEPDFERDFSPACINAFMKTARQKGFFVTYNHPTWSLESYGDYIRYEGMHAFEIMNGGCLAEGFDDYNPRVYDDLLRGGKQIYCIGADDNHNGRRETDRHWDSGVAFTVIKAESLDYRTVTKALQDGHFYASEAPEIFELYYEDGVVTVKCSDADRVICTCGIRSAQVVYAEGQPITEASFTVSETCGYFRITVVDEKGRHACTNAYFMKDLLG